MVESLPNYKEQAHFKLNGCLTLPQADKTVKETGEIVKGFTFTAALQRQIEQVGSAYEKLKVRVSRQIHNEKNKDQKNFVQ